MKLVVGINQQSEKTYIFQLIKNGVFDFFLGYVPDYWYHRYGFEVSPNRRYDWHCQFTDLNKLQATAKLLHKFKRRVFLTLNDHYYIQKQFPLINKIVEETKDFVDCYIVAWPFLVEYLNSNYPGLKMNLSGDFGLYSATGLDYANRLGVNRIIFPREVTIEEMAKIIAYSHEQKYLFEFEAFAMESPCLFNGAYCFVPHGFSQKNFCNSCANQRTLYKNKIKDKDVEIKLIKNCGLCFLHDFQKAGIDYLKVPGREGDVLKSIELINKCFVDFDNLSRENIRIIARCESDKNIGCYYEY